MARLLEGSGKLTDHITQHKSLYAALCVNSTTIDNCTPQLYRPQAFCTQGSHMTNKNTG